MYDRRTAVPAAAGVPQKTETDRTGDDARGAKPKGRFARDLTRSVFGRYYWDDRLEAELRRQLQLSKQRLKQKRRLKNLPPTPGVDR